MRNLENKQMQNSREYINEYRMFNQLYKVLSKRLLKRVVWHKKKIINKGANNCAQLNASLHK